MPTDPWNLVETTVAARYRVEAVVAEGGSGLVYRAADLVDGVAVALKVLKPSDAAGDAALTLTEEFVRERDTLARVEHPAIVRGHGQGEIELPGGRRTVYLALEWVDGKELDRWLKGRGPLPPAEAVALLAPVFQALSAAHRAGVVHRDVKPANVMVEDAPGGPRVRLLDFGIAKLMQPDETLGPQTALTANRNPAFSTKYAAPEQLSGAKTGPWTDVHAMGLLMTEVLTGRRAYEGTDFTGLMREILAAERPTPGRRGVDVGPLEPVLERALSTRPQSRYADMGEFWGAVQTAASERVAAPVAAPPAKKRPKKKAPASSRDVLVAVAVGAVLAVATAALLFR